MVVRSESESGSSSFGDRCVPFASVSLPNAGELQTELLLLLLLVLCRRRPPGDRGGGGGIIDLTGDLGGGGAREVEALMASST
jgi:hypothetical protein